VNEIEDPISSFIHLGYDFRSYTKITLYDHRDHMDNNSIMGPPVASVNMSFDYYTCYFSLCAEYGYTSLTKKICHVVNVLQ